MISNYFGIVDPNLITAYFDLAQLILIVGS